MEIWSLNLENNSMSYSIVLKIVDVAPNMPKGCHNNQVDKISLEEMHKRYETLQLIWI
jgi:hypothetical protein